MFSTSRSTVAPLVFVALFACGRVTAQAHGPASTEFLDTSEADSPASRSARLAGIERWLRRLPGRFLLTSSTSPDRPGIVVDCVGIGTGPGVQCMTGRGGNTPVGEETNASMQMFGMDPMALTVSRMTVNGRSISQHAQGRLQGDTLVFPRTNCAVPENARSDMNMLSCVEILKIRAPENRQEIQFTTETILYTMPPPPPPGVPRRVGSQVSANSWTMWMKRVQGD